FRPRRVATPETSARQRELMATLERCLTRLAQNRQQAVRLYLQGFTVTEAAELLGWSRAKARHLTYRGREELRRYLRAGGIEYEAQR
ncbi:MAG: sigma factor-like helix-turn-helix DNA-binding protein, partial [Acidobacteriota bacterium]